MVRQGDIIKINLNPTKGHEEAGYRPVLVISRNFFHRVTGNLALVCPISNTKSTFPLHIPLEENCQTTGSVLCQHMRTLDVNERNYNYVESVSQEYLEKIIKTSSSIINPNILDD